MRAKAYGTLVSVALLAILGLGIVGVATVRVMQRLKPEVPTESAVREIWVTTEHVRFGNIEKRIRAIGEIQPVRDVRIASKLPGKIRSVHVEEGNRVHKGQVVVELDTTELETSKRQALAALAAAKATVYQGFLASQNQEQEFTRIQGLFDSQLISEQQLQQIEMMTISARSQYEMAKINQAQAEAAVELAETRRMDAQIRSPIQGVIVSSSVNQGEVISPGMTLMRVIDLSVVKVEAKVPETEIMHIHPGAHSLVFLVGYPDIQLEGKVTKIAHAIHPGSHSFGVTVEVENPNESVKSGMSALVDVLVERKENVLLLSRKAVSRSGDRFSCYVVDDQNVARFRQVDVYLDDGTYCEVQGVSEGERVIIQGNFDAVDGAKVIDRKELDR